MILDSIKLDNIRSYKEQTINFPRGITLFEGDVGSGKSTVLMGIEFALFGLGSIKAESLLSRKAEGGSVTLKFEVDGTSYEIGRALKRSSNAILQDPKSAYLKIDGVEHPFAPSELKQKILRILKFNEPEGARASSYIYRYAVFTPQSEMNTILRDKKMRLETIRRAFHIEDYRTARVNAEALETELKNTMRIILGRFEKLDTYQSELGELEKRTKQAELKLKELRSKEGTHVRDEGQKKADIEKLNAKMQERTKLEGALENGMANITAKKEVILGCKNTIAANEKELLAIKSKLAGIDDKVRPTRKTAKQIQTSIERLEDTRDEIASVSSEVRHVTDAIKRAQKKLGVWKNKDGRLLQTRLAEKSHDVEKLKADANGIKKTVQAHDKSVIRLQADVEKLDQSVKNISRLGAACEYCGHVLTSEHLKKQESERKTALTKAKDKLRIESAKLDAAQRHMTEMESKMTDLDSEMDELQSIIPVLTEHTTYTGQLAELRHSLKTLEDRYITPEEGSFPNGGRYKNPVAYLTALKDALLEYNGAALQASDLKERKKMVNHTIKEAQIQTERAAKSIDIQQEKCTDMKERLVALKGIQLDKNRAEKNLERTRENLRLIRDEISSHKAKLTTLKEQTHKLGADIKTAQKWKAKYDRLGDCHEWLDAFFIPTVSQIEKQVMLTIQQSFDEAYRVWYAILIDDPTKESHMDEEFTPIIEQDGYVQNFEYLSGGEKTSMSLAYRLTLNSMMRQETDSLRSNLLILDEPTEGFSKTQLAKLRGVLDELKSEQIILVSHEKELEAYVDNIFHITKNTGISSVARISG